MSSLQDIANEIDKDCAKQPDDTAASESALNDLLCVNDVNYLISRLEQIKEHINNGNYHMASAKLLADISALSNAINT